MKFGKQLRFIAVKKWEKNYIQYKNLKAKLAIHRRSLAEAVEQNKSEEEVMKIKEESLDTFESMIRDNVQSIIKFYIEQIEQQSSVIDTISKDLYDQMEKEQPRDSSASSSFQKKLFIALLTLYELRTFLKINTTGTEKIMKKFVKKMVFPEAKAVLSPILESSFADLPTVHNDIGRIEELYVLVKRHVQEENESRPRQDIIEEFHKSVQGNLLWKQSTVLDEFSAYTFKLNEYHLGSSNIRIIPIVIAVIVMLVFMFTNFFGDGNFEAQRCLGLLLFCSVLWATTAIPLWLTSLSIPFFTVVMQLTPSSSVHEMAKLVQKSTMSSTVYLIIGGFTIAAAFKKTEMDKRLASMVLSRSTGSPGLFLFSVITLNAFLAMWINNVASTMIVVSLVLPTIQSLPPRSNFVKLILISIAAGGNFGGLMTPLSSPQNAITVTSVENVFTEATRKQFGFAQFLSAMFPLGAICCVFYWIFIRLIYKNDVDEVPKFTTPRTDFGWRQIVVSVGTIISIVLWIVLPFGAEDVFGDNGIVGFIPLLLFYGTGILPPSEVSNLPWNILFLVMGGNALGYAVENSGLLHLVSDLLNDLLGNTSLWVTSFIIALFVLIINMFISHTVAATILLPIICEFAKNSEHLRLFALIACAATTASQIFPVSSFPNLCCVSIQGRDGKEYITTTDIIKSGSLATTIAFGLVISVLYWICIGLKL